MEKWKEGAEERIQKEAAEKLQQIGCQILRASRDELYLGMRFLDVALSSFLYVMDPSVTPFGTDGYTMYFHPSQLGGMYRQNRILVNRGYLHMVLHCIFRHMVKRGMDNRYWNVSCDIAAEHIIDGCDQRAVRFSRSLLRRETYRRLEKEQKTLHAERIYQLLTEWELSGKEIEKLEQEFCVDDHCYWENQDPQKKPDSNLQKKWQKIDEKMETDLEIFSKEASKKSGDFLEQLKVQNKERCDYKEFLRKFSVFREEVSVDPDTFDYHFYSYGLSLYGNMPLIEPQETKEVKKVKEFVVVIDTSMSCSGSLVKRFLEETYSVLTETDGFFQKVNVHIIQCDEEVQSDVKITSAEELKEYMEHLRLFGEGGTDFRPAFSYCTRLLESGEFENLKGLIYFTDGYGIYPHKMPPYQTAFVFLEEEYEDVDVPPWAMKLILTEEEWEQK
ncbi:MULTISPECIES: vWA domain-containing protein [Lachnospiraceae]|jgi:predicted metal-dependent peptidase|uniref:VWA-like domain-containing protein n=1 Tax=Faecalicatena acetigenes TaxID=2981790 RepID=A0ABT2T9D5_9FIRM|nr:MULTISPECIES: VWA-like domain-containing protein [Lachnospiraceae]MCU6746840.1 VWA-like domain-containing protein [Faecalicatena acetigenes]SCH46860.1 Uncharacterized protein conserved in bacteria [uncultured Clostridium sp.]